MRKIEEVIKELGIEGNMRDVLTHDRVQQVSVRLPADVLYVAWHMRGGSVREGIVSLLRETADYKHLMKSKNVFAIRTSYKGSRRADDRTKKVKK